MAAVVTGALQLVWDQSAPELQVPAGASPKAESLTQTPAMLTASKDEAHRIEAAKQGESRFKVKGLATLASGHPVACEVRVSEVGGLPENGVLSKSDAYGRFEVTVPATWETFRVVAETAEGAHAIVRLTKANAEEVTIVLRRLVDVKLRLRCNPAIRAAAGGSINCGAQVWIERFPMVSLLARSTKEQIAAFDLDKAEEQTIQVRIDCAENNTLTWYCGREGGQHSQCQRDAIPANVESFESECVLDVGMMLLATVVDTFGQPLPHARFLAWSDKKTRRMMCRTDENGRCIRVVLPGDHGRLELPWRYSPWVEGGDQWQHDAECPTWSAGVAVRVVADMSKVLRIRFADWRGTPISSFKWSHHNDGMRTQDGKVIEGMGEHASGVAYLYSKSTLPKGSAVFVRVPGVGESYAVVDRDLHPEQGVHTLTLNRVAPQSLKIRLAESFPVKVGGTVTLQLQTAPNDPVRKSYFISFVRTALSKEFFLRDVLPGSYVLKTSAGAYSHPKQFVTLKPGGEGLILLE